jgi:hypothetical protein
MTPDVWRLSLSLNHEDCGLQLAMGVALLLIDGIRCGADLNRAAAAAVTQTCTSVHITGLQLPVRTGASAVLVTRELIMFS